MKDITKQRDSSFELLRIIAMIMIVLSHCSVHGSIVSRDLEFGFNKLLLQWSYLGNIGVDLFIMISGYFLVFSKFNLNKLIKLELQVLFYSIIFYFSFVLLDIIPFSITNSIKAIFPTLFLEYSFFSAYFIMYLLFPYINLMVNSMNEKTHKSLIIVVMIIWAFIPTFTMQEFLGNYMLEFFMLYIIGAYCRKYYQSTRKYLGLWIFLVNLLVLFLSSLFFDLLSLKISLFESFGNYFYKRSSIFVIFAALGLLMFAKNLKFKSRIVNVISSCTFGIFLIHDNNYVRDYLWKYLLDNSSYANSNYLVIYLILSVFLVFIVSCLIEMIRKNTIEKITDKFLAKLNN